MLKSIAVENGGGKRDGKSEKKMWSNGQCTQIYHTSDVETTTKREAEKGEMA